MSFTMIHTPNKLSLRIFLLHDDVVFTNALLFSCWHEFYFFVLYIPCYLFILPTCGKLFTFFLTNDDKYPQKMVSPTCNVLRLIFQNWYYNYTKAMKMQIQTASKIVALGVVGTFRSYLRLVYLCEDAIVRKKKWNSFARWQKKLVVLFQRIWKFNSA